MLTLGNLAPQDIWLSAHEVDRLLNYLNREIEQNKADKKKTLFWVALPTNFPKTHNDLRLFVDNDEAHKLFLDAFCDYEANSVYLTYEIGQNNTVMYLVKQDSKAGWEKKEWLRVLGLLSIIYM